MIKKLLLTVVALFTLSVPVMVPVAVSAIDPATSACNGLQATGTAVNCNDSKAAQNSFGKIIRSVINILSIIVGAVSVVMIIIGGFRYVISGGDSNGVQGAKNTIIYAIVGLVVVLFAQVIVRFVLANVLK